LKRHIMGEREVEVQRQTCRSFMRERDRKRGTSRHIKRGFFYSQR
jgi:hypothetical protein